MSMQTTPPNRFLSDTNIPQSVDQDLFVNVRKRKQPDPENTLMMARLEEKFNLQLSVWDRKFTECITSSVTMAVNAAMSSEMEKMTSIMSEINANISKLNADYKVLSSSLENTISRVDDIEKSQIFTCERQDEFENRFKTLECSAKNLTDSTHKINQLENKIISLEQQALQCNIELCNLPERRNENLLTIVECLGNAIKLPICKADIVAVHRVPHAVKENSRPKNIILKLTTRVLRDNIISAYRAIKGLDSTKFGISGSQVTTVYLNEHLSLNNKILFRQCRESAKKYEYKYVWVKHGIILVRKHDASPVIAIRSQQDIYKIK